VDGCSGWLASWGSGRVIPWLNGKQGRVGEGRRMAGWPGCFLVSPCVLPNDLSVGGRSSARWGFFWLNIGVRSVSKMTPYLSVPDHSLSVPS
jgi:hypothetical protein